MAEGVVLIAAPLQPSEEKRAEYDRGSRLYSEASYVDRLLCLCARRTLHSTDQAELAALGAALDAAGWHEVATRARAEGLDGLVLMHASEAGLLPRMPPEVADELLEGYRTAWIGNRRLRGVLAEVLAALAARGVETMPVKGVALALRYYGEPALRPAGDLDLLVRRADVPACRTVLQALGCQPYPAMSHPREFRPLFYRALVYQHPSGLTIELHWELTSLPAYLPRLRADAGLWARAESIEVLGQQARYLAPADELRYLALHAAVQHADLRRLIWLVDIAELLRNLPISWDWEAFVSETVRLGLAGPVAKALLAAQAGTLGPLPVPHAALDRLSRAAASPREQRALRHSLGLQAGVRRPGAALRALWRQDGMADRAMLLWHLIGRARRRWLLLARERQQRARHVTTLGPDRAEGTASSDGRMVMDEPANGVWPRSEHDDDRAEPLTALLAASSVPPAPNTAIGAVAYPAAASAGALADTQATARGTVAVADPTKAPPSPPRVRHAYHLAKRTLDIVVSALLLVVLAPAFLLIACLVKLDGGPIIYPRAAIGYRMRPIVMHKFRTMRPNADALLLADPRLHEQYRQNFKLPRDPRVTPIGRWLRRTSLDELPQLWDVLRGAMSLVGPRAVHADEVPLIGEFFAERQSVPPGLTGLWQVSGRASNTYERRIAFDREYVRTCSFWRDLGLLARTVPAVLDGRGAY